MADRRTAYRVCSLCEATCGIAIEIEGDQIVTIRGDKDDSFSQGYICPKAYGLKGLHEDPDRLRHPMRRTADGWEEISWDEAYAETAERLQAVRDAHGNDAVGMYTGNPVVHELGALAYMPVIKRALGTKSLFNASAVDTLPKQVAAGLVFGLPFPLSVSVPDVDRTAHMLIIGANPVISHGSLMTAPNIEGRIKGVIKRGGKVVVLDPRRTETADIASEHHFIRPATDAVLLFAMVYTMFDEKLVNLRQHADRAIHLDEVEAVVREFTPEMAADYCGVPADTIRRLTREFCAAESAVCYGRLGTCIQEFGTLATWGVELLNVLSGNLDRPGGAMFTDPAAPLGSLVPHTSTPVGRWHSRVSGQPESYGEIPASTMAEEMDTPGEGQVRAMMLIATNPVCSAPNAERLDAAFASLDFLVCVDWYINETTRHAHIILPPVSPLEYDNYDLGLYSLAVRNVAKYTRAAFDPPEGSQQTWQILLTVAARLMGMGEMPLQAMDDFVLSQYADAAVSAQTRWEGLTPEECVEQVGTVAGPERLLDVLLRIGPYGDGFGRESGGLTLAQLAESEHGRDFGPLTERIPALLGDGPIDLAPALLVEDVQRLQRAMAKATNGHADAGSAGANNLVLIGRRDVRSTNSHLHNVAALVKGRDRCTLMVSEPDALAHGVETGGLARVTSEAGSLVAPVHVTDEVMPGVVSLPHGWGHDVEGVRLRVARAHPGVNSNILTSDQSYDDVSGTAVMNGIPVTVEALH